MRNYRKIIDAQKAELQYAKRQLSELHERQDSLMDYHEDLTEALYIAQQVALMIQQQVHSKIAGIVTRCIQTVFGEDTYQFDIQFVQKRNKTEAELVFTKDGVSLDPLSASGGGVVDVAAFALRLSCMLLTNPKVRKVLVLDEPFKFVSAEYRKNVKYLIKSIAKELDFQIIMVTHINELVSGNVVEI